MMVFDRSRENVLKFSAYKCSPALDTDTDITETVLNMYACTMGGRWEHEGFLCDDPHHLEAWARLWADAHILGDITIQWMTNYGIPVRYAYDITI